MFYTVYKVCHLESGKVYVGTHQTQNPHDRYMGSGVLIRRAIAKHGVGNFVKEVLFLFDNADDMFAKEAEIVTPAFAADPETYNLAPGGNGGWFRANQTRSIESRRAAARKANAIQKELAKEDPTFRDPQRKNGAVYCRHLHATGKTYLDNRKGIPHTEETKEKMRSALKGRHVGALNSQFGTVWVCRGTEKPKKIPKADLERHVEKGWKRGRKTRNPKHP